MIEVIQSGQTYFADFEKNKAWMKRVVCPLSGNNPLGLPNKLASVTFATRKDRFQ